MLIRRSDQFKQEVSPLVRETAGAGQIPTALVKNLLQGPNQGRKNLCKPTKKYHRKKQFCNTKSTLMAYHAHFLIPQLFVLKQSLRLVTLSSLLEGPPHTSPFSAPTQHWNMFVQVLACL